MFWSSAALKKLSLSLFVSLPLRARVYSLAVLFLPWQPIQQTSQPVSQPASRTDRPLNSRNPFRDASQGHGSTRNVVCVCLVVWLFVSLSVCGGGGGSGNDGEVQQAPIMIMANIYSTVDYNACSHDTRRQTGFV